MKHVMIGLFCFFMCSFAFAVSPFSLPWVNHAESGTVYNSDDYPNGVFVVEAWYLNCPYCNYNAPNVNELAEDYKDEPRVQVLDVGIDRYDSYYDTWIEKHNPNHPVLKDDKRKLISQLGTTGYPSTYIVDCKGKVHYSTSGEWNASKKQAIRNTIDRLLAVGCKSLVHPIYIYPEE